MKALELRNCVVKCCDSFIISFVNAASHCFSPRKGKRGSRAAAAARAHTAVISSVIINASY